MKQSANALTFTGLAGAVAVAGASQAYGTIINVKPPTNINGVAPGTATGTIREYWDVDTGTTSASKTAASDFNFGVYSGTSSYPNEFFTGIYGYNGGASAYVYVGTNSSTYYAFGPGTGKTVGTGGTYASFTESTTSYTIMSLTYNGKSYLARQTTGNFYYVPFQFTLTADGLKHDGWVELESLPYVSAANPGGLRFIAAAYNSVPDGTTAGLITTGQMGTNAIPEPGTLGALAVGAAALVGVGLKRRRKNGIEASLAA